MRPMQPQHTPPARDHWEQVYRTKAPDGVSWYAPHATVSLALMHQAGLGPASAVIDVGGGASTLVDDLLAEGVGALTVLDLSEAALAVSQARLGPRAEGVQWLAADITDVALPAQAYDIWHDRAVFHFMTTPPARNAYLRALRAALRSGGHVVIATFAEDGPERCSGLPVTRYSVPALAAILGDDFTLLAHQRALHPTPFGTEQAFNHALFRYQPD